LESRLCGILEMGTTPEYQFYERAKTAVESYFTIQGYTVDFEVTGYPPLKKVPERFLKEQVLLKYRDQLPIPDIMGWVASRWHKKLRNKLVVVEFKKKPKFWDVFQAKGYDELFDADLTLLLSQYPLYESSRKLFDFLSEKPELTRTKDGMSHIVVKFLHITPDGAITLAQLGTDTGKLPDAAWWEI